MSGKLPQLESNFSHPEGHCCKVAMCEGSSPHMSKETRSLLRTRLRMASLMLATGFGVFFLRQLFLVNYSSAPELFLLIFHGLTAVTLLTVGGRLCQKCSFELSTLRIAELMIFGVPSLYFIAMQWLAIRDSVPFLIGVTAPWMLLILTYSLYIPNTWQRAAWVLGLFAATPTALCVVATFFAMPGYSQVGTVYNISTVFMTMTLAAYIGTWGVHTINRLRHEAFEARQLGQYRLKRLLGAGGMGEVHLAEHQLMKRPVAIKLIKAGIANDPTALARFHREVQATAKLTHWNSVEVFDYGHTDDGTFYYVMEYLPGKSLADLVQQHGAMDPGRVVSLLEQVCEALSEAHKLGLIHRDIKPGNIFAAERGGVYDVAKLLDFGLAKPIVANDDITLTQQGAITGSPLFMSPEQATGDAAADARSDIYALGCVAYYMLTGHPPFEETNAVKVLLAHANRQPVPPSQVHAGIPADLERIVLKCLEKKPADRYPTVAALWTAFAETGLHGKWTRDDASHWWQENGGVSHDGAEIGVHSTVRPDAEPTIHSASKHDSGTRGPADNTHTDLSHDSAPGQLVG
jgi:serine/threonine protein kinase